MDKTAANWIEIIWDLSIYYDGESNPYDWAETANKILGIKSEFELEEFKDETLGTAANAFCFRPIDYKPKREREFYNDYI